jgi:hypothetical protein
MAAKATKEEKQPDHNVDRYPNIYDVLSNISEQADLPNGGIERLEVSCFASGEATYRYWTPRAEEPEGGYLPRP